ncbi:MAG: hypothetical protein SOW25_08365 [Helicobacter sp.]|nr:hypothetical protein [Helicobacteraceae bacterium]MDY3114318.1 hypothetical protein [Helicobacter sp.]
MKYYDFGSTLRSVCDSYKMYEMRMKDAILVYDKFKDTFKHRNCPICDSNNYTPCEKFLNRYEVALCNVCNSHYINPAPSYEALAYYYNKCECNAFFTQVSNLPKAQSKFNDKVALIEEYLEKFASINGGGGRIHSVIAREQSDRSNPKYTITKAA